mgnify:FL=1|tara:strand:+ start:111 stop:524 length:414 start_codon:yes stop_codon:yes gene_type:complete
MVTFRNNNGRRNTFRRNDRGFKSSGERNKFNNNYSNTENFQRKAPGRNNHNASKLIDKYNNLAREALSVGDKILSENYFQHADHFTRILNEKEIQKKTDFKSHNLQDSNNLNVEKVKKIERLTENENSQDEEHSEVN